MPFIQKFQKGIRGLNKEEALAFVQKCYESNEIPESRLGVYRFYVAERFEDYTLARNIEREYHKKFPDQFGLRYLSAGVAIALKNFEEAKGHLITLIEHEEESGDLYCHDLALLYLAYVYREQGQKAKMQASLDKIEDRSARTFGVGEIPDLSLQDFLDVD